MKKTPKKLALCKETLAGLEKAVVGGAYTQPCVSDTCECSRSECWLGCVATA